MKPLLTTLVVLFTISSLYAQVGIGTSTPTADLEIISKTGLTTGEFNGVIIPKVSVLPTGADLPTAAQTGLILYLDSNDAAEGFYFFNGTAYINVTDTATASPVFYNTNTIIDATNTTDNISRSGNISVGGNLNTGKLNIEVISASSSSTPAALRIDNSITGLGADASYGIFTENKATSTGIKYGIRNEVSSSGNSHRIGIRNEVRNSSESATNNVIGIDNFVGATNGTSALNYGIRSEIGTASSNTNNYGIYSIARGSDIRDNYSGYFRGDKFAIRNEDDTAGYNMPVDNGTNGQVLTTNGAGVASWGNATYNKSIVRAHIGTQWLASSGSSNPGDYIIMEFDQESIDTNNEFDTSTFTFTAASSGFFKVCVQVSSNDYDGDSTHGLAIYKGANLVSQDVRRHSSIGSTFEDNINRSLTDIIQLNIGETITIRFNDNFATFAASTERNFFTIEQL